MMRKVIPFSRCAYMYLSTFLAGRQVLHWQMLTQNALSMVSLSVVLRLGP